MAKTNIRKFDQQSWLDSGTSSDFQYEFSIAKEPEPIPGFKANPAFEYMNRMGLEKQLYAALDKLAPLLPIPGFDGTPLLWYSPPPSGSGNRVALVIVEDGQGTHRFYGSNIIGRSPEPSGEPVPTELFDRFIECKSYGDTTVLITKVLNSVVDTGWHWAIELVESEGERFRTMPIYVAIVTSECIAFCCTSSRVEGRHQSDMKLECYGELAV